MKDSNGIIHEDLDLNNEEEFERLKDFLKRLCPSRNRSGGKRCRDFTVGPEKHDEHGTN